MKSKMKKILSFVMAVVMIFSICIPSFAASANSASEISVNVEVDKASYRNLERMVFNTYVENHSDEPKDVKVRILHTSFIHTKARELNFKQVAANDKAVTPFFATAYRTKLPEESYDKMFELFGGDISVLICRFIAFLAPNMECMVFEIEDSIGAVVYSYEDVTVKEPVQSDSYTVTFDLNYEGAPEASTQEVKNGELALVPEIPTREGFMFKGWFANKDCTAPFDFSLKIVGNQTAYAGWIDLNDDTDTDRDKLYDVLEDLYGTDKNKADTDSDGLTDYEEINLTATDPKVKDTDKNGIDDAHEDIDKDRLNNKQECQHSTYANNPDSDNDKITDYDEIFVYSTNPLSADSDNDGITDYEEIQLKLDPNKADSRGDGVKDGERIVKKESIVSEDYEKGDAVKPYLDIELKGSQLKSLNCEKKQDTILINPQIPGYIGNAYDFKLNGEFSSATLSFEIPKELFNDPNFDPAIFYFNEEKQVLEEVKDQTVSGNIVTAKLEHFSTYIVIARNQYYDEMFRFNIEAPATTKPVNKKFDVSFVLDESGSVGYYDFELMKDISTEFISKLTNEDRVSVFTFDDRVTKHTSFTTPENAKSIVNNLVQSGGNTAIYNAIHNSNQEFIAYSSNDASKIMIVLTDGNDNESGFTPTDVIKEANEKNIIIYTIGVGDYVDSNVLRNIAESTGGNYYTADSYEDLSNIFVQIEIDKDVYSDSDEDSISDYHEKKLAAGEIHTGTGIPVDKKMFDLSSLDYKNFDTDDDGICDGSEISIESQTVNGETVYYANISSNPCLEDTDGDRMSDLEERQNETNALDWNVSVRDLAMMSALTYEDLFKDKTNWEIASLSPEEVLDANSGFHGTADVTELNGWKIVKRYERNAAFEHSQFDEGGLCFLIFEKDNNIVLAVRGSHGSVNLWNNSDWYNNLFTYPAMNDVDSQYIMNNIERYLRPYSEKYKRIYITGHSRGGMLAQRAAASLVMSGNPYMFSNLSYFNGIGISFAKLGEGKDWFNALKKAKDRVHRYSVETDLVDNIGQHVVKEKSIPLTYVASIKIEGDMAQSHDLCNFTEHYKGKKAGYFD